MRFLLSSYFFISERLGVEHPVMARAFGFDAVELWGMPPHLDCADPDYSRRKIRMFLDEGIAVPAIHGPFYETLADVKKNHWLSIASREEKHRAKAVDMLKRAADLAEDIDNCVIVTHFGAFGDDDRGMESALSSLISLEDHAAGTGVRFAFENVNTAFSRSGNVKKILDDFAFRHLGICLDSGHANLDDDPADAVANAGDRLIHLHLSDNEGHEDDHLPPGGGIIPWEEFTKALIKAKFNGTITIEPVCSGDQEEGLKKVADARDMLAELLKA